MNSFFDEVLVVLVIYQMKIDDSPAYRSLSDALNKRNKPVSLFIHDNSPLAQSIPTSSRFFVQYFHDLSNPGVSKAYNRGFELAKSAKKKWLLLTDQDSTFPVDASESYSKCALESGGQIIVPTLLDHNGILSPFKFSFGGGKRLRSLGMINTFPLKDFFFVNSGLLISLPCFERAMGYDENLPLDFSDLAFAYRLKKENDSFTLANIVCQHVLSSSEKNLSVRLKRFENYAKASKYFNNQYAQSAWIAVRVFIQAVNLSIRFRDFRFIVSYFL